MTKIVIGCLLLLTQIGHLWAQRSTNFMMGIANNNTNGQFNTSLGYLENIPGIDNYAPYTFGTKNTYVGSNSGNYGLGSENSTLGTYAGGWKMSGSQNVFIGANAAANALRLTASSNVGTGNTIMGYSAGFQNQTDYNVFIGYQSGYTNSSGNQNVFVGTSTGYANTASGNTFMGYQAGQTNSTGSNNTFMGWLSGQANTTGLLNVFIGGYTGYNNTSGQLNTFLGYATGMSNTTGRVNTFIGGYAGESNTTGIQNSFVGYQAGRATTTGNNNTIMGYQAGSSLTTGSNNIIVGPKSGTAVTDGSDNVLMGYNSQAEDGLHNAIAIGAQSHVAISNAMILGHQVNVGIGTSAPTARLEVNSGIDNESGIRLSRLTANSPVQLASTDKLLTVDATGKLVLTSAGRYSVRSVADWSDKVFMSDYRLRSLTEVDQYIQQHQHLPDVPSATEVVERGIDAARMDAKLLEKIEELTLYTIQLEKDRQNQQAEIDELKRQVKQLLERE